MKRASSAEATAAASSRPLWLWLGALIAFLVLLWTAMFTAARQARIQSVPLATQEGKP